MRERDLNMHVRVLGWIHILSNSIFLLVGLTGFVFLTGFAVISGDTESVGVLGFMGGLGFLFLTALAAPGLLAGYGLLKQTSWARVLALVVGFLSLFIVPIGTAIGIYTGWVMLRKDATDYFANLKIA